MICLKNRTFAVSQTTHSQPKARHHRCDLLEKSYFCSIANNIYLFITNLGSLWFAWKIVLLQYRKQPASVPWLWFVGCDLLEKSYFCSIANNSTRELSYCMAVVICLKNRTFAVSQTTHFPYHLLYLQLWFAWKIVLLQYRKQLSCALMMRSKSCDLLEKSYFCSIANNLNLS